MKNERLSVRHRPSPRFKLPYLALISLIVVAIWYGFQAWLAQDAVRESSPLTFNVARFAVGFAVMLPVCLRCHRWPTRREWHGGLVLGAIASAAFACDSFALKYDPAGRASFLGGLYVIAMPLGAWLIFRKRQAMVTLLGCAVVVCGAFLLWYAPGGTLQGDGFAVLRAAVFVALLSTTRRLGAADFQFVVLIEFGVISLISLLGANLMAQPVWLPSWNVWGPALACGIGGSAVCAAIDMWAYPKLSVALVGVLVFAEAPTTALWGLAFGQQPTSQLMFAGFGLVTLGTVAVIVGDLFNKRVQQLRRQFTLPTTVVDGRLDRSSLVVEPDSTLPEPLQSY